jgi:hypothetical protein
MDIPADALQIYLSERAGVSLADPVTLNLGYDGEEEQVFTGSVARIQPALRNVVITALGRMNALLNQYTSATYEGRPAGDIARDLISQAGLATGTIDDGPGLPRFAIDRGLSGFVHLKGLANRLGYELYANREGAVMFHALGDAARLDMVGGGLLGAAAGAISSLASGGGEGYLFGQHLLEASTYQQPSAWGQVQVGGESPMSGQGDNTAHWLTINDADYRGSAGSDEPTLLVLDPAARTKDLADRFAAGYLAVAQRTAHQVTVRVSGRPQVELGDTLSVGNALDDLLNGSGYVRAVQHRFDVYYGFVTDFRISMSVAS